MEGNNNTNNAQVPQIVVRQVQQPDPVDYREFFEFIWRLRYWMLASVAVAVLLGVLFLRAQTPVYERSAWIMLNSNDGSNTEQALLSELTGLSSGTRKIDNEVFILKSPSLITRVVNKLGINKRYFEYCLPFGEHVSAKHSILTFKQYEFYKDSPFVVDMTNGSSSGDDINAELPASVILVFHDCKGKSYVIDELFVGNEAVTLEKKEYGYGYGRDDAGCTERREDGNG